MKSILIIIILFVSTLASSCNYIPCSSSSDLINIKSLPDRSEIAGIYRPDEYTRRDVRGYFNSDSTYLVLTKGGDLYLNNFPKNTFSGKDYTIDTSIQINGIGFWNCSYKSKTVTINSKIELSDPSIFSPATFDLYKKDNKFVILLEIGDPDICLAIRLFQQ